jgi:phosphatidylinositol alpha-mannosyltransferase
MRIIQVSPYSWDAHGGVQAHVRQLARHLEARGHEVLVLAPGTTPGWHDGACIIGRPVALAVNGSVAQLSLAPSALTALGDAMARFGPEVVHVHEPFALGVGVSAVWSAPAPVVATFHSHFEPGTMQGQLYTAAAPLLRPTWKRVALRIAVSRAARHSVKRRLGKGDIRILPNGVDVDRFALAEPARDLPQGRRLLFVGRLEPRKGLGIALQAFTRLAESDDAVQLLVVGDGPERELVAPLPPHVRARVHLLGRVSDDALPSYYRAADVFVAPSTGGESFGIVLAEAMAAGLPIVASDITGYRDVARANREAVLVRPNDPTALADALAALLADPDERARLGANGALRARTFDWSSIVDELEAVYRTVTGQETPALEPDAVPPMLAALPA